MTDDWDDEGYQAALAKHVKHVEGLYAEIRQAIIVARDNAAAAVSDVDDLHAVHLDCIGDGCCTTTRQRDLILGFLRDADRALAAAAALLNLENR